MKNTTSRINLPLGLHNVATQRAALQKLSLSEYIDKLISKDLENMSKTEVEQLNFALEGTGTLITTEAERKRR